MMPCPLHALSNIPCHMCYADACVIVAQVSKLALVIAPSPRWGGACAVVPQVPRTRLLSGVQQGYPSAPCTPARRTPARHALALWCWRWLLPWLSKNGGAYPCPRNAHNGPAVHSMLFGQWIVFDPTNSVRGAAPSPAWLAVVQGRRAGSTRLSIYMLVGFLVWWMVVSLVVSSPAVVVRKVW